jgi:putative methionine-R-sulfoxide reductase with GAF domain
MSNVQVGTQSNNSPNPQPIRSGHLFKMWTAGFLVLLILIFTLAGANSTLDSVFPGLFAWCFSRMHSILTYFFVTHSVVTTTNQTVPTPIIIYNTKDFFLVALILIFAVLGAKNAIGKWALWICSREKEKGPLYSWLPNFLYSEYAIERYKLANKDEEITKLQKDMKAKEQDIISLSAYLSQLKEAINITLRDRRLVHNLDNLIGKCYVMSAQVFSSGKNDDDRLKRFLSQICAEICSTTIDSQNNKHANIFLRDFSDEKMVLVGECRSGSNLDGTLKFSKGEGFVGRVWDKGEEQLYTDISTQAHDIIVKKGERRYNSIAGVPIKHRDEVIGIVVVSSQQANEVSEADYDNISRYLNIIQLALLIECSNIIPKGGDEYESLVKLLQQKNS